MSLSRSGSYLFPEISGTLKLPGVHVVVVVKGLDNRKVAIKADATQVEGAHLFFFKIIFLMERSVANIYKSTLLDATQMEGAHLTCLLNIFLMEGSVENENKSTLLDATQVEGAHLRLAELSLSLIACSKI